jgi:hypothetical protein
MLKSDDALEPALKGVAEPQEEVESKVPEGDGEKKEESHTVVCSRGEPHVFSTDADYTLHEREAQGSILK